MLSALCRFPLHHKATALVEGGRTRQNALLHRLHTTGTCTTGEHQHTPRFCRAMYMLLVKATLRNAQCLSALPEGSHEAARLREVWRWQRAWPPQC